MAAHVRHTRSTKSFCLVHGGGSARPCLTRRPLRPTARRNACPVLIEARGTLTTWCPTKALRNGRRGDVTGVGRKRSGSFRSRWSENYRPSSVLGSAVDPIVDIL